MSDLAPLSIPPTSAPVIHLVEDDESSRTATERFLRASGYAVRAYATASAFLAAPPGDDAGCVILDLHLPDASGLDLQRVLVAGDTALPVIFLTGDARVPDSVEAMKSGAVDFLMKAGDTAILLAAVERALVRNAAERAVGARRREVRARYATLTARERDVFAHLIGGELNKQIGYALGISVGTTKIHRQRVLQKMGAASLTDLVRMAGDLEIAPAGGR